MSAWPTGSPAAMAVAVAEADDEGVVEGEVEGEVDGVAEGVTGFVAEMSGAGVSDVVGAGVLGKVARLVGATVGGWSRGVGFAGAAVAVAGGIVVASSLQAKCGLARQIPRGGSAATPLLSMQ
ncbi:hypothetical protein ACWDRB_62260 [Nonomuraea sp. NPDC003707]